MSGGNAMKTGPLDPLSKQALSAMDRIYKILAKVPRKEWEFVLKQAKSIADAKIASEEIKAWVRRQLKRQKRKP